MDIFGMSRNLAAMIAAVVFSSMLAFAGTPQDGRLVLALGDADPVAVAKALKQGARASGLLEHPEYPSVQKTALQWLLGLGVGDLDAAKLEPRRLEVAKLLFANGAKLSGNQDEVYASIVYGHEQLVRLLLDKGLKPDYKIYGYTLPQMAYLRRQPGIEKLLVSWGGAPVERLDRLQIDIVRGAKDLDAKAIEEALRAGGNINAPDPSGETGLTALLSMPLVGLGGGIDLLEKFLVDWKANPAVGSSTDNQTFPIIQWVKMNSFREEDFEMTAQVLEQFVLLGVDVNAADRFKQTSLHAASEKGNVPACRTLLKAGARAAAADFQNRTPISVAKNAATRALLRGYQ
jgi:hypothetical protein